MSDKTIYRTIIEGLMFGGFENIDLPTDRVDFHQLTVEEVQSIIKEEFAQAKKASDVKAKEKPWNDAELDHEIDWVKALSLKEFFVK